MKRILIFALLLVFAAFPVFAQVTVGGELDYYMSNGFDDNDFMGDLDKAEVNFNVAIGDYNSVSAEIEATGGSASINGVNKPDVHMNYLVVETDWAMMFGLEGFTIATTVGLDSFGTFDNVSFTGFTFEDADDYNNVETSVQPGFKVNLGFLEDLIQPYFSMAFNPDQGTDGEAIWLAGVGFDFDGLLNIPLWLEVYYGIDGDAAGFDNDYSQLGIEALYALTTDGGLSFDIGGFFLLDKEKSNTTSIYGAGVGFGIAGFDIGASFLGKIGDNAVASQAFSIVGIDADYFFLEWLGVNAGASFSFMKGTDIFQTFEAGVIVNGNEDVTYKLGYIYSATDLNPNAQTLNVKDNFVKNGGSGLYFATVVGF